MAAAASVAARGHGRRSGQGLAWHGPSRRSGFGLAGHGMALLGEAVMARAERPGAASSGEAVKRKGESNGLHQS